jgi:hypothetical protein
LPLASMNGWHHLVIAVQMRLPVSVTGNNQMGYSRDNENPDPGGTVIRPKLQFGLSA